jgi:hypothetical protein
MRSTQLEVVVASSQFQQTKLMYNAATWDPDFVGLSNPADQLDRLGAFDSPKC